MVFAYQTLKPNEVDAFTHLANRYGVGLWTHALFAETARVDRMGDGTVPCHVGLLVASKESLLFKATKKPTDFHFRLTSIVKMTIQKKIIGCALTIEDMRRKTTEVRLDRRVADLTVALWENRWA